MALNPLATVADLTDKGIDTSDSDRVNSFLAAAQAAVRDAAGVPITRETFTVTIPGTRSEWLALPGQPVTDVTDVVVDDVSVTGWKLVGGSLWNCAGWQARCGEPSTVTLTITGGLDPVPADIVDLVCAITGLALNLSQDRGYASRGDLIGLRIDDYMEQYERTDTTRTAGPIELPPVTRQRLRSRFGGNVVVLRSR